MTTISISNPVRRQTLALPLVISLIVLCAVLIVVHFSRSFSTETWQGLLFGASKGDMQVAVLYYSALPRLAVALLAGACLGLGSTVLQIVLRNPIAEPATLGISGGASLALSAASLWAPALLVTTREVVGLFGAGIALLLVLGLASGEGLSPIRLILGGLIVSLLCGTVNALLVLFHHDNLQGMFIWNAGSLVQNDWQVARLLFLQGLFVGALFLLLSRALTLLHLEDDSARSLGLSLGKIRLVSLLGALLISAAVASSVGVVGFVGLAGATLARAAGARSLPHRLLLSATIGAALLTSVDQGLQIATGAFGEIPAGGLTALLGAPLLLWMLPRLMPTLTACAESADHGARTRYGEIIVVLSITLLVLLLWPALALTHDTVHWHLAIGADFVNTLSWRWPRTLAALSAGFMLGIAGVLTQRLTSNPLASPEILGISSGAAIGALLSILAFSQPDRTTLMAFAALGAVLTLVLIFMFARRESFSPERMLLAGVAVSTLFSGLVTFLLATGDPRLRIFLGWMAGAVSRVTPHDAIIATVFAAFSATVLPALRRWLEILPFGQVTVRALGLNVSRSRYLLFVIIATLTAVPTMLVGPLSFVGLMSPHIVRMIGIQRPLIQSFAAGIIGATIMLVADILGRTLLFPYEVPAGLMASMIGGPYFLWLMRSKAA